MTADMYARINTGIEFLTAHFGSIHAWINEIDLETLDMQSLTNCIIGQLFGSYRYDLWPETDDGYSGHPYGFDDKNQDYAELTEAWVSMLANLRETL